MSKWNVSGILIIAFITLLSFFKISDYPLPFYDEGTNIEVARNLLQHGTYAQTVVTDKEFAVLDNSITVGPTLTLPLIIALKIGGIHIGTGRVVVALYFFCLLFLFYRLLLLVGSPRSAFLGLLFFGTYPDALYLGRQVMGEIPALFFLVGGLLFLTKTTHVNSKKNFILAGLFFGFAVLTKEYYGFVLGPLLLGFLLYHFFGKANNRFGWLLLFIMFLLPEALFIIYKIWVLGREAFMNHLYERGQFRAEFWSFSLESFRFLKNRLSYWVGFFYFLGLLLFSERRSLYLKWFLFLFFALWTLFYIASNGWTRFALPLILLGCYAAARFCDLLLDKKILPRSPLSYSRFAFAVVVTLVLVSNAQFGQIVFRIYSAKETDTAQMANFIRQQIPPKSIIETNDPEMLIAAHPHPFHRVPQIFSASNWIIKEPYRFLEMGAPYLLEGSKGRRRGIYPKEILEKHYRPIHHIGRYILFERL